MGQLGTIHLNRLLGLKEAAEQLGMAEETLRKKRKAGQLPCIQIGRQVKVQSSFVEHVQRHGIAWPAPGTFPTKAPDQRAANVAAMEYEKRLKAEAEQQEVCSGL